MKIAFTETFPARIVDCRCIVYEAHNAMEVFGLGIDTWSSIVSEDEMPQMQFLFLVVCGMQF